MQTKKSYAENYIKDKIKAGEWTDKLPSEPVLMERINVGRSTLREAVSSLVAQKVLYRKPFSGVFVRNNNKGKIVYFFDRTNSNFHLFYDEIKNKIVDYLQNEGYEVLFNYFVDENSLKNFETMFDGEIKGVISEFCLRDLESLLDNKNIPYVNISTAIPVSKNNIVMDYYYMLALACGLMDINNHNDFSVMYIDYFTYAKVGKDTPDGKRFEYIIDLCKKMVNNDKSRLISIPWTVSLEESYFSFKEWWSKVQKPASIIFMDDAISSMVTRAIGELNIKIPQDLALITIGDILVKYPTSVKYTRIYHKTEIVAKETVKLLLNLIDGKYPEGKTIYLKSDLKIGESI